MSRQSLEPITRSVLRIIVGFTFSCHGLQKIFGLLGGMGGHGAKASFLSLIWVAGFLEAFGGLLIMLGLFTGYTAFLLSGEMAVGYFRAHATKGFWPILNGGELAVLYCFLFLYLFVAGAGPLSLDRLLGRRN